MAFGNPIVGSLGCAGYHPSHPSITQPSGSRDEVHSIPETRQSFQQHRTGRDFSRGYALTDPLMRTTGVEILYGVFPKRSAQMIFTEDDDVIQALPPDSSIVDSLWTYAR